MNAIVLDATSSFSSWFDRNWSKLTRALNRIGYARTAAELRRLGYAKEAARCIEEMKKL
jgi:hypothetical protein